MRMWISNITNFTINTGRFYSISKYIQNDDLDKTVTLNVQFDINDQTGAFTVFSIPL